MRETGLRFYVLTDALKIDLQQIKLSPNNRKKIAFCFDNFTMFASGNRVAKSGIGVLFLKKCFRNKFTTNNAESEQLKEDSFLHR